MAPVAAVLAWCANTVLSRMPNRANNPSSTATISPGPHGLADALGAYAMGLATQEGKKANRRPGRARQRQPLEGMDAGRRKKGPRRAAPRRSTPLPYPSPSAVRIPRVSVRGAGGLQRARRQGKERQEPLSHGEQNTRQHPAGGCGPRVNTHRPRESTGPTVGPVWTHTSRVRATADPGGGTARGNWTGDARGRTGHTQGCRVCLHCTDKARTWHVHGARSAASGPPKGRRRRTMTSSRADPLQNVSGTQWHAPVTWTRSWRRCAGCLPTGSAPPALRLRLLVFATCASSLAELSCAPSASRRTRRSATG